MGAFKSSMDIQQFIAIVEANRSMGDPLPTAYERAERIHEHDKICGGRRFSDFEVFEQRYYQILRKRRLVAAKARESQRGNLPSAKIAKSAKDDESASASAAI
ncbi:hypothetical protein [Fibrella aestuarina]|nr:hypothetical protein [Fibrella aestuarina]